jgi:hypothetical protein
LLLVAVDDPDEGIGQIGKRIDVIQLTGFDQRGDDGPVLGAAVGACEQRILPVERNRRIERSTALLSSSMQPSSMKRVNPSQRESV